MTFENRVKKFIGKGKFKKLTPSEKANIRRLSSFQKKTKRLYKNGFSKVYEELGIL